MDDRGCLRIVFLVAVHLKVRVEALVNRVVGHDVDGS